MLQISSGKGAPENISVTPRARISSARPSRSSPSTTPIERSIPASAAALASASRQPRGFTPPALATTLIPLVLISGSQGTSALTKSGAKPASGVLARARAISDMVTSAR